MKTNMSAAEQAITKAQAALETTIKDNLKILRKEKKELEAALAAKVKLIEKITGKSEDGGGAVGNGRKVKTRKDWTDTILALCKGGKKSIDEINKKCGGTNQYQKVTKMVEDGKLTKEGDRKSGVTYHTK
jgi:hypothetical protein